MVVGGRNSEGEKKKVIAVAKWQPGRCWGRDSKEEKKRSGSLVEMGVGEDSETERRGGKWAEKWGWEEVKVKAEGLCVLQPVAMGMCSPGAPNTMASPVCVNAA